MNLHLRGKRAWGAGFGLVLLVNAIVLGGAFYNRSGEEARLVLSERELEIPFRWDRDSENTGLELRVKWRTPAPCEEDCGGPEAVGFNPARASWSPDWLDEAKMRELGFSAASKESRTRAWQRALSREVWVVLEFDGPEHQRAIRIAERDVQTQRQESEEIPGDERRQLSFKAARERLENERSTESRLFAIDAGLDAGSLHDLYPQRDRHLIVRARVRPAYQHFGPNHPRNGRYGGWIQALSISSVHVPLQFREVFEGAIPINYSERPDVHYSVTLAYGLRHEPWIVDAARAGPPSPSTESMTVADKPKPARTMDPDPD